MAGPKVPPPKSALANKPIFGGDVVLVWAGADDPDGPGGKSIPGVPADNLTDGDINRAVYIKSSGRSDPDGSPISPLVPGADGFDEERAALVGFMLMTGLYKEAPPAVQPDAAEQPKE